MLEAQSRSDIKRREFWREKGFSRDLMAKMS